MKQQIKRLQSCPHELLDKIEILISDNCSTDDTQTIVEEAISQGFKCRYIRNETNLGMDGNFVSCFRKATGKYVWLLGDDDVINIESLVKIVVFLDSKEEYGLLHIDTKVNKNENEFITYTDQNSFVKRVSYWFTFISANIVSTKYVPDIAFEEYMGTWFTLIPLYVTALAKEKANAIANITVFDSGKDVKRNGGYNFFIVFVQNFQNIMDEFVEYGYITQKTNKFIKKDIMSKFIRPHIRRLLFFHEKSNYKTDGAWRILFKYYGNEPYFYYYISRMLIGKILRIIKVY